MLVKITYSGDDSNCVDAPDLSRIERLTFEHCNSILVCKFQSLCVDMDNQIRDTVVVYVLNCRHKRAFSLELHSCTSHHDRCGIDCGGSEPRAAEDRDGNLPFEPRLIEFG